MNFLMNLVRKLYCHFHAHTCIHAYTQNLPDSDLQPMHILLSICVVASMTPGKKTKSIQVVFFL